MMLKKFLSAGLLVLALAATAHAQQEVVSEPVKDLGGGFEQKVRIQNDVKLILIHFPDKALAGREAFEDAIPVALVKSFGCKAFKKCRPQLRSTEERGLEVLVQGEWREVFVMMETYYSKVPAGIGVVIRLPKANQ
jgi:hypothetical protein